MRHHRPRVAGLLAILAALVLAPSALAGTATKSATKAEQRAYGKYCKVKGKGRSSERNACLKAMAKLDKGRSSSPSKACKALSRKKLKGERKSAYARCVSEGAKLLKAKRRAAASAGDDLRDDDAAGVAEGDEGEDPEPIDDSPGTDEADSDAPPDDDETAAAAAADDDSDA